MSYPPERVWELVNYRVCESPDQCEVLYRILGTFGLNVP